MQFCAIQKNTKCEHVFAFWFLLCEELWSNGFSSYLGPGPVFVTGSTLPLSEDNTLSGNSVTICMSCYFCLNKNLNPSQSTQRNEKSVSSWAEASSVIGQKNRLFVVVVKIWTLSLQLWNVYDRICCVWLLPGLSRQAANGLHCICTVSVGESDRRPEVRQLLATDLCYISQTPLRLFYLLFRAIVIWISCRKQKSVIYVTNIG